MVSFQKAFWSKIAVAGHGTRYLFRLFSRIISEIAEIWHTSHIFLGFESENSQVWSISILYFIQHAAKPALNKDVHLISLWLLTSVCFYLVLFVNFVTVHLTGVMKFCRVIDWGLNDCVIGLLKKLFSPFLCIDISLF